MHGLIVVEDYVAQIETTLTIYELLGLELVGEIKAQWALEVIRLLFELENEAAGIIRKRLSVVSIGDQNGLCGILFGSENPAKDLAGLR